LAPARKDDGNLAIVHLSATVGMQQAPFARALLGNHGLSIAWIAL